MTHPLREKVIARFAGRWASARPVYRERAVEFLTNAYDRFRSAGLADRHFEKEILRLQGYSYWQREAEILLADTLWKDGFSLDGADTGPDFKATKAGVSMWVELHTPEPTGIPIDHLNPEYLQVYSVPYEALNLRWTSAIKEKAEKLLGNSFRRGYLSNGIVGKEDIFVIAVNQHLLHNSFRSLAGISQYPAPVEILFAVGPYSLSIDPKTLGIVGGGHVHRPSIRNAKGATVPSNTFLDPDYAPISALLGVDLMVEACIDLEPEHMSKQHLSALAYNPFAINPLPVRLVSAQEHWGCRIEPDQYMVERI